MKEALFAVTRLLAVGWVVVVAIGLGLVGGIWLDGILHSSPLFTIVGVLLGVALAFVSVYRMIVAACGSREKPSR